jgi:polar amino acid transport system substrate-binding protein
MCPPSRVQAIYLSVIKICFAVLILAVSACGYTTPASPATAITKQSVPAPIDLFAPHTLTVGMYGDYLPQEFVDSRTGQLTGFDVDMINALAQRMNLKASFVNESFSSLLDDLVAKNFDVVISAVVITADLQKKVTFIPYLKSGEALLVSQENPPHVHGVGDLCGRSIAVKENSVEYNELAVASSTCQQQGQQAISLIVKDKYQDLIDLLSAKSVIGAYIDLSQANYYLKLYPAHFVIAGSVINPGIEGIAIRLNDPSMLHSFQAAFQLLKNDGTYQSLLQRWGLSNSGLSS